jgi:proteasome lid subunit RPN8/RPN11
MTRVALPADLRAQILREAQVAGGGECCGLVEGSRDGDLFRIIGLHPARNLALAPDRFEIDPKDHLAAHKAARANGRALIGCYHSHPNGQAAPSATDLAGAGEDNFLWLIAAGESLNAFVYRDGSFFGADWVTSSE